MFHLSRSRGFMSHGAHQRLLRFDVSASVTVFQLKQADGSMSVSDRRKSDKEKTYELHDGSKNVQRTPWKADKEKTHALQTRAPSIRDGTVPKNVVKKRPQGADPRVPGRKQDRCTDLVSKATRRRPTRSRKATSSFSQQRRMLVKKRRRRRRPASSQTATSRKRAIAV